MCVRVRYSDPDLGGILGDAWYDSEELVVYVDERATLGQALTFVRQVMTSLGAKQHDTGCTCFCGECVLLPQYNTVSV